MNNIDNYIFGPQPFEFNGTKRYSTLIAGLRDCRTNTQRDINTGVFDPKNSNGDVGNWLSCIGYFTILDQIGSCFKNIKVEEPEKNYKTIKFAIEQFGYDLVENDNRQLNALLALRNAFTHDFNLVNIPDNNNNIPSFQHKFTVQKDTASNWVVKLPDEPWDGNIDGKDFIKTSDITFINLFGFGQLVEEIYLRICNLQKSEKLNLRMSEITLINKYTFVQSYNPLK